MVPVANRSFGFCPDPTVPTTCLDGTLVPLGQRAARFAARPLLKHAQAEAQQALRYRSVRQPGRTVRHFDRPDLFRMHAWGTEQNHFLAPFQKARLVSFTRCGRVVVVDGVPCNRVLSFSSGHAPAGDLLESVWVLICGLFPVGTL